jgi:class 3 adenylate cyclase
MSQVKTKRGGDVLDDFLTGAPGERKEANRKAVDNELQIRKEMREGHPPPSNGMSAELYGAVLTAVERAEKLFACGLTRRALVVLITDVCPRDAAGRPTTEATVERVLEGLSKLGEHLE